MSRKLLGKPCAESIAAQTQNRLDLAYEQGWWNKQSYIAIVRWGDHAPSATYTRLKMQYADRIGISVTLLGRQNTHPSLSQAFESIEKLNKDPHCKGIMIQLPLPQHLQEHQSVLVQSILPQKDIDGLAGQAQGKSRVGSGEFMPATPKAVISLLEFYDIVMQGRTFLVVGQSTLTGGSLAMALMHRQATVFSCNKYSDTDLIQECSRKADVIVSCAGVPHLIDDRYIRKDKTQYCIDVGFTTQGKKIYGDVDSVNIHEHVAGYSPVPGGIGPVTIACLFMNVFIVRDLYVRSRDNMADA